MVNRKAIKKKKSVKKNKLNVDKLLRELKKLNAQTNVLKNNINRNSRKISNIIRKLTKKARS